MKAHFETSRSQRFPKRLTLADNRASIWSEYGGTLVTDLEKLSKALADDTPEKVVERAISEKADEIAKALEKDGVYEDGRLGLHISAEPVSNGR